MKLATPQDTWAWGHALGASLAAGAVVALCGPLGGGKTQAAKGLSRSDSRTKNLSERAYSFQSICRGSSPGS